MRLDAGRGERRVNRKGTRMTKKRPKLSAKERASLQWSDKEIARKLAPGRRGPKPAPKEHDNCDFAVILKKLVQWEAEETKRRGIYCPGGHVAAAWDRAAAELAKGRTEGDIVIEGYKSDGEALRQLVNRAIKRRQKQRSKAR